MNLDLQEFEKDRNIDPNQLDLCCVVQPDLFFKYAQMAIVARGEMDRAKIRMDVVESTLQIKCRKDPTPFGLIKITETGIKAAVCASDEYQNVAETYMLARETTNLLDKAVQTMEMKKRMLESLITLHGQQYFAGPSTPRNLTKAWQLQREEADRKLNERQKEAGRKRLRRVKKST